MRLILMNFGKFEIRFEGVMDSSFVKGRLKSWYILQYKCHFFLLKITFQGKYLRPEIVVLRISKNTLK